MPRAFNLFAVTITLLYPLAIWLGEGLFEPRVLAILLLVAVLARLDALKVRPAIIGWLGGTFLLLAIVLWTNGMLPLKLYPVVVNLALLGVFTYSLVSPPSVVERIARIREPKLRPAAIGYTRRVTQLWCIFFAANGTIALVTAVWTSPRVWWFYNGLIAYVVMGMLFAGEYCVRRYVRSQQDV
jgi:uncharacterized membrane protein